MNKLLYKIIVNNLGGMTKGAVYHHFKSKEEIINALADKMFLENNPFSIVKNRNDLNGLQNPISNYVKSR